MRRLTTRQVRNMQKREGEIIAESYAHPERREELKLRCVLPIGHALDHLYVLTTSNVWRCDRVQPKEEQ